MISVIVDLFFEKFSHLCVPRSMRGVSNSKKYKNGCTFLPLLLCHFWRFSSFFAFSIFRNLASPFPLFLTTSSICPFASLFVIAFLPFLPFCLFLVELFPFLPKMVKMTRIEKCYVEWRSIIWVRLAIG